MIWTPERRNVLLLAIGQALFVCSQSALILIGGLVGFQLADDKSLATVPVTAVILGTACMTVPASLLMRRVGRPLGFAIGGMLGIAGSLICALGVWQASFWLVTFGALVVGFYNGFCQYYRFAAADTADPAFRSKAISLVLAGGVVAGLGGPQLALATRDVFVPVTFAGTYITLAALAALAVILSGLLRIPPLTAAERRERGRPMVVIMRQPTFVVAVMSSVVAYGVMSFLMTATPLAMVACALPIESAGFVIQWHVVGMFAPSFFTGHLIARFGLLNVMFTGGMMLGLSVLIALAGLDVENFWGALFLLGVGWNFVFVGATTLLTEIHTPSERAKTQAANDFIVFGTTAIASFSSGKALHYLGWHNLNLVALPLVLVVLGAIVWLAQHRRAASRAA